MHSPDPGRRTPLNTYRLELSAAFTFASAHARLDYLDKLGVTHLYLSPILTAAPGSTHGYDVVDPTTVSDELGGLQAFTALADAAHARGMGIVLDVCPNHMAICDPLWANPMLWSALRDGEDSPYYGWFDIIDDGRLIIPFLPDDLPALLEAGRITIGTRDVPNGQREPVLLVDQSPYPLAPGTEKLPVEQALASQRYTLVRYSGFETPLNHRRFFDIISLIGIRQERRDVFDTTHALLFELIREGYIDGLRIDHSDGLTDPEQYFEWLAEGTGGLWTITEKVLAADEHLPEDWRVHGTSGYDAAWRFDAVQLDPAADAPLTRLGLEQDGDEWLLPLHSPDLPLPHDTAAVWEDIERASRQIIATANMAVDVRRLVGMLATLAATREAMVSVEPQAGSLAARPAPPTLTSEPGQVPSATTSTPSEDDLGACLHELLYALDRYRTYVRPGREVDPSAEIVLGVAAERAARHLPDRLLPVMDWVVRVAAYHPSAFSNASAITDATWRSFVQRLQQLTGVVVGKGIEDTGFYRWPQLLTLCEVGADPCRFGLPPEELHGWLQSMNAAWPATMTLGSTHDSKRSEDLRARLSPISEYPDEWEHLVRTVAPAAARLPAALRNIWRQTLAATWTQSGPLDAGRLAAFMRKAGREQRLWTSWFDVNEDAEAAVEAAVPELLQDPTVRDAFGDWHSLVAESVRTNTLCTKLVQLTALGVADIYQGCETVRLNLTDPDNRRPIDWDELAHLLDDATRTLGPDAARGSGETQHGDDDTDGAESHDQEAGVGDSPSPLGRGRLAAEKLFVTTTALHLRRSHPEAFTTGGYTPLASSTEYAWGFARGHVPEAITIVTRLPRAARAARGVAPATAGSRVRTPIDPSKAHQDRIVLPQGTWRNLLTGTTHESVFFPWQDLGDWPCALLSRVG